VAGGATAASVAALEPSGAPEAVPSAAANGSTPSARLLAKCQLDFIRVEETSIPEEGRSFELNKRLKEPTCVIESQFSLQCIMCFTRVDLLPFNSITFVI